MRSFVFWRCVRYHATFPSYGRPTAYGECGVDNKVPFSRRVPLASSMNLSVTTSNDIRAEFLSFFRDRGHALVAPSSVYPRHQEGAYFVNAGMSQFKPLFMRSRDGNGSQGSEFFCLNKAANSQPCIRIGGRHGDLNDVGYDTSHHTMFEMLGNWSFGSYGKEVACRQMWQFLTGVLGLPSSCLYVTYFGGSDALGLPADDETRDIWLSLGVSDQKLLAFGAESNFWRADRASGGGLCGPSTEIHVDFAALSGRRDLNCARCMVNSSGARVVELWNCVFITHRMVEETDFRSTLLPLSCLSVDTGMGLERLASVMQGTMTTYDTDVFMPLLAFIHSEALRITGYTMPSYSSCYMLPVESEEELSGRGKAESDPSIVRRTKLGRLSNLLRTFNLGSKESGKQAETTLSTGASTTPIDYETLHRDVAYRLVADHSRALSLALQDGLLPGRQGVGLKLRHLVCRATRAAVLTGLDSVTKPSLLQRIITQIPPAAPFPPDIEGPLARPSAPVLSTEQISDVIKKEVNRFIPRLSKLEDAFNNCLRDADELGSLSDRQVEGLQIGRYGEPVSWDMICAQARWYGLKIPSGPPQSKPGRRSSAPPSSLPSMGNLNRLRTLLKGLLTTQDHSKYQIERVLRATPSSPGCGSSYTYEVPPLKAKLVALIHGDSDNLQVVIDRMHFTKFLSSHHSDGKRLGLVFDQSNFFSPCGGQISDVGVIKATTNQKPLFSVLSTEKIFENNPALSSDGWVIHWVTPGDFVEGNIPTDSLYLCPDSDRRFRMMRSHTAQHLLHWAFEDELASIEFLSRSTEQASPSQPPTFHHGGHVEPDRCSVYLTLIETPEKLETLVENVQARCRAVIEAKLPIVCQEVELEQVIEKPYVKRFTWEIYPPTVRVVCVGGDMETIEEKTNGPSAFYSAELCGGTHLHKIEDLVDVIIVGLQCRNQSIKKFVAISGESAARSRDYGERMLSQISTESEALKTDSQEAKGSIPRLLDCAERLIALMSQVDLVLGGLEENLSYLHRSALTRCQKRLSALLGGIKDSMRDCASIPVHVDPLMIAQLERLFKGGQTGCKSSAFFGAFNVSNFEKLALSILHLSPKTPIVLYQRGLAVFYHPEAKGKAVEWATATTGRLDFGNRNLSIRVEDFRKESLGVGADHFAVVRLFSLRDQRQRDWKPYFDKLVHSTAAS
ncbi:alanyl tRNA synthetase mitochondrial [Echinococcus multilocularis]|uniref:alanine--tRNA ligase n=1 Tax=Echinococcus multilocularis TaxID=6211 RepID=A0A068Y4Q4_ECHMU|nr:alanyl tRNA synthetase mitochondrial [Echinococcus multilocularis]